MSTPSGLGEFTAEIRWPDLDGYGHVHHVAMLQLVEHVRGKWLEAVLSLAESWEFILARIEADYRTQLRYEDRFVRGHFRVERIGTRSVTLGETLTTPDGSIVVRGRSVMVGWDTAAGCTRRLTSSERERFAAHV